jgi:hypothetical protein
MSLDDIFYIYECFVKYITLSYSMENSSALVLFSFHLKYYPSTNQIPIAW